MPSNNYSNPYRDTSWAQAGSDLGTAIFGDPQVIAQRAQIDAERAAAAQQQLNWERSHMLQQGEYGMKSELHPSALAKAIADAEKARFEAKNPVQLQRVEIPQADGSVRVYYEDPYGNLHPPQVKNQPFQQPVQQPNLSAPVDEVEGTSLFAPVEPDLPVQDAPTAPMSSVLPPRPPSPNAPYTAEDGALVFQKKAVPSAGQQAIDKAFGKDYAEAINTGSMQDVEKQLESLRFAQRNLESGNDKISGSIIGNLPDFVLAPFAPDAISTRQSVEQSAQRALKNILGAQFTQKEGEQLIQREYNPRLSEAENARRLSMLIRQIESAAKEKQAAMDYFEQNNGSLAGWRGQMPRLSNFGSEAGSPVADTIAPPSSNPSIDALVEQYR